MALNKADFDALEVGDPIGNVGNLFGAIVTDREGGSLTIKSIGDPDGNNPQCVCVWNEELNLITDENGKDDDPIVKDLNGSAYTLKVDGLTLAKEWREKGVINQEQYGRLVNAVLTTRAQAMEIGYL